jgi:uncharacterized surface protein with fasciclin (FAS1) repeats
MKNIVETAIDARSFKILITAVQAADLIDTLSASGPFTAFAPNDDAFLMLPLGTIDKLVKHKEELTAFLTYHVVPGKVMAADLVKMTSAQTVQGGTLTIAATDGVKVNDATVIEADVECTNGVIHVIDSVLMHK